MTFEELKTKFEFGLLVLGYDLLGYHLVTDEQWAGKDCSEPHIMSDMVACERCRMVHFAKDHIAEITDMDLITYLHRMVRWMNAQSKQQRLG